MQDVEIVVTIQKSSHPAPETFHQSLDMKASSKFELDQHVGWLLNCGYDKLESAADS